jgi:adenylate cyclase class 2
MHTEYEVRILEIDIEKVKKKLEDIGAKFIFDSLQKRYVYDFKPIMPNKWIRLRTNGKKTTLTIKDITSSKIDGTKELEIVVDDFEKTNEMLELLGYIHKGYQENKRIRYILDGVEIDIDSWPLIPTYMEIEGKNVEEVEKVLGLLDVPSDKVTTLNCEDIYKEVYNIDIDSIKELKFK